VIRALAFLAALFLAGCCGGGSPGGADVGPHPNLLLGQTPGGLPLSYVQCASRCVAVSCEPEVSVCENYRGCGCILNGRQDCGAPNAVWGAAALCASKCASWCASTETAPANRAKASP
jgi:hypothetical protein